MPLYDADGGFGGYGNRLFGSVRACRCCPREFRLIVRWSPHSKSEFDDAMRVMRWHTQGVGYKEIRAHLRGEMEGA